MKRKEAGVEAGVWGELAVPVAALVHDWARESGGWGRTTERAEDRRVCIVSFVVVDLQWSKSNGRGLWPRVFVG